MPHPLLDAFQAIPDVRRVLDELGRSHLVDVSASSGTLPFLLAALARRAAEASQGETGRVSTDGPSAGAPMLVVTATTREADDLASALTAFLPAEAIGVFPSWETLPHERLSPRSDTVGRRLGVLRRLAHPDPVDSSRGPLAIVVAPVRAALQPITKGLGDLVPVSLKPGDERPLDEVVDALAAAAYVRTDLVERRGEFAVRGGILDVFSPTEEHPVRVEFWGDTVEEIRWFKVADQRSMEIAEHGLWAPPCREMLLTPAVRERAAALAPQLPGVADMLAKVAEGIAVEGMESLAPALVDGMESVIDVLPHGSLIILADPERVRTRAHDLLQTSAEFLEASWSNAAAGNHVPVDLQSLLGSASFWTLAQTRALALATGCAWWTLTPFAVDDELVIDSDEDDIRLAVHTTPTEAFRGDTEAALAHLRGRTATGWRVAVVTQGPGLARRVLEVLRDEDIRAVMLDERPLEGGVVGITSASLGHGFVHEGEQFELLTETDLTGQAGTAASTKDMRRMPSRRRNQVDPLQLHAGDHVVHEQHGVGRFVEMMQRTVAGATREYLVIEYAPSRQGKNRTPDLLYVPTDQLDQVTKYSGGENPTLSRMGGSDWSRTKSRARRYVKQIANELIRLYSARQATKGFAFGPDTPWQRELEDAFAHVETPDQLSSVDEVKSDMEQQVPMDRLICGDVGYGKTEIAVRAAFKAIQDGKQVAILVPTTLLVSQHQQTFSERYAQFPVTVRSLSRFQSDKEAREVLAGMADGSIDIVIGTHRLLANDARFKDLGLVVIDEEQRFGVEHKELLKTLRTAVDVLSMSATPIPRTLEMAVTGIREMSTLETPPEERHPVLTFVGAFDELQIAAAVRRELLREGQVFYIHNKVSSIEKAAARLRELVPEARIATAHGQMPEHRLERVVADFWEKRSDVLVCTTIVETGLDISNANTLIVE
ncbi:MAG: DEAD/DEAH box helicase, partial [Micrococcales bacterium]|nr:DEAD/DEAH box helicase [Micrococcales bacterium]